LSKEEDDYEVYAGDAMRRGTLKGYTRFEQKGDPKFLIMLKQDIKCYEEEAKSCDAAILQHFIAYWKAVKSVCVCMFV